MNLTKAELLDVLDEQRRMVLEAERQVAAWRRITARSRSASTNRFALQRSERQLAAVQRVAKAVLEGIAAPAIDDVASIMADTHRIANDPDLWPAASMSGGKAGVDDVPFVELWEREGAFTVALTNVLARLSARGIDLGLDVMAEIGPALHAARS